MRQLITAFLFAFTFLFGNIAEAQQTQQAEATEEVRAAMVTKVRDQFRISTERAAMVFRFIEAEKTARERGDTEIADQMNNLVTGLVFLGQFENQATELLPRLEGGVKGERIESQLAGEIRATARLYNAGAFQVTTAAAEMTIIAGKRAETCYRQSPHCTEHVQAYNRLADIAMELVTTLIVKVDRGLLLGDPKMTLRY